MSNVLDIRKHTFQPGAMSIIQMGEELIGHPSTAINELVKNGYDADALESKVYFHYSQDRRKTFAIIYDNGNGMDSNLLFGDWLKPSVSTKRRLNAKSEIYKRNLLGSKGIGRLAAMALGEKVTVISRNKIDTLYSWITVNRESFKEERLLSEISFPGDKIIEFQEIFSNEFYLKERESVYNDELLYFIEKTNLKKIEKGTIIVIEILDEAVIKILFEDYSKIEYPEELESYKNTRFYKSLATLITPLKLNSSIQKELRDKGIINNLNTISDIENEFLVEYSTNLLPENDIENIEWLEVKPIPFQSVYDYRVYGKVTKEGNVAGIMSYKRLEVDIYEESFNIALEDWTDDREQNKQMELFDNEEFEEKNESGEYYFDIRIYDIGEKENLEKLAKLSHLGTITNFRKAFRDFQGLRISKNGFAVKPYGDEVEDWIELSKARVQDPGKNVNTNQILGYVFFYSPENDNLEEKTNREGFLENKAFQEVKSTMKDIFSEMGKRRYNYRLKKGLGRIPTSKHRRPDFDRFIKTLYSYNASKQIVEYSEKFLYEVSTAMDNIEESLSFSERLASLGSGIELVYHEMAQPISRLRTAKSSLELKTKYIDAGYLERYKGDIGYVDSATDSLAELRTSLQPAIGRTRKKKFFPLQTFLKVCNLYNIDIEDHNIKIIIDERLKEIAIYEIEYTFWISFLNIINNAVYWLKKTDGNREIRFLCEEDTFIISNSGPLINEDIFESIFEYGVTNRKEKNATGLGLAYTISVLSRNNWDIYAQNCDNGPAFILKKAKDE